MEELDTREILDHLRKLEAAALRIAVVQLRADTKDQTDDQPKFAVYYNLDGKRFELFKKGDYIVSLTRKEVCDALCDSDKTVTFSQPSTQLCTPPAEVYGQGGTAPPPPLAVSQAVAAYDGVVGLLDQTSDE